MAAPRPLMNLGAVASLLGVSKRGLRHWVAENRVPVVRLGRLVRFRAEVVEQLAASGLPPLGVGSGNPATSASESSSSELMFAAVPDQSPP